MNSKWLERFSTERLFRYNNRGGHSMTMDNVGGNATRLVQGCGTGTPSWDGRQSRKNCNERDEWQTIGGWRLIAKLFTTDAAFVAPVGHSPFSNPMNNRTTAWNSRRCLCFSFMAMGIESRFPCSLKWFIWRLLTTKLNVFFQHKPRICLGNSINEFFFSK